MNDEKSLYDEQKKLEEQEGITFYYDREKRLSRMSSNRSLYEDASLKRGFFKVLVNAPGGKYMIIAIFVMLAVILLLGVFNKKNEDVVAGVCANLSAFCFEDKIFVTVKLTDDAQSNVLKEKLGNGLQNDAQNLDQNAPQDSFIRAEVFAVDANGNTLEQKTLYNLQSGDDGAYFFRTTFGDYEVQKIDVVLYVGSESKKLSANVSR